MKNGKDILADMELLRLAFPGRVLTLSQTKFLLDSLKWLYKNRKLVGGQKVCGEATSAEILHGATGTSQ